MYFRCFGAFNTLLTVCFDKIFDCQTPTLSRNLVCVPVIRKLTLSQLKYATGGLKDTEQPFIYIKTYLINLLTNLNDEKTTLNTLFTASYHFGPANTYNSPFVKG
jgi:hypothetical protein